MSTDFHPYILLLMCAISHILCEFNPSADNILYSLNWPGPLSESDTQLDTVSDFYYSSVVHYNIQRLVSAQAILIIYLSGRLISRVLRSELGIILKSGKYLERLPHASATVPRKFHYYIFLSL